MQRYRRSFTTATTLFVTPLSPQQLENSSHNENFLQQFHSQSCCRHYISRSLLLTHTIMQGISVVVNNVFGYLNTMKTTIICSSDCTNHKNYYVKEQNLEWFTSDINILSLALTHFSITVFLFWTIEIMICRHSRLTFF